MQETSIKPMYPCCKFAQGPVEALLQAMTEAVVEAGELEEIRVEVSNREVFDIICSPAAAKWAPGSVREAQFSLPFLMAWAAIYRSVDLSLLAQDSWRDADVLELARRVHIDLNLPDSPTARGRFPMPGVVQISTRSGLRVDKTVEYVSGHPSNPMSPEQLLSKFTACTGFGRQGWHHGDELVALIFNLEHEDSVTHLARLCA
jgi:2-methylcitrate dehydratase PrpD